MGKKLIWVLISIFILVSLTGCSKDEFLSHYDSFIGNLGRVELTNSMFLKGKKSSSSDGYSGEYIAKYENFNRRECIFGGTNIDFKDKDELVLKAELTIERGFGKLFYISGSKEAKIILEETGEILTRIKLKPGANYIYFEGDDCDASLDISIK